MLLSTFELLVKKIAPANVVAPFNRTVVQGYFLTISNINLTRDITFNLVLTIPSDDLVDMNEIAVDREFVRQNANITPANHIVAYDINGVNNFSQLSGGFGTNPYKRYVTSKITLKKGQTVSVQILPNIANSSFTTNQIFTGNPVNYNLAIRSKMEIRGFVEIFQAFPTNKFGQSLPATDILVNAEIRGTFLDSDPVNGEDYDQINYSLELASGKSLTTLAAISNELNDSELGPIPNIEIKKPRNP
ncbi:hypothetical protein [Flavobacterium sp.]|uniref:hypothetical protein n=1 Tax=Flavobacterium sp. TaxID=239 RepID=UPI00261E34CF|nr:hypothetical protein [Flavobacterium sp.]